MGRDEWELSHEYRDDDRPPDEEHERMIEVLSRVILALALIGVITVVPWIFALAGFLAGLAWSLFIWMLSLLAGLFGLVAGFVGLAAEAVAAVVGIAIALLTSWPVLVVLAIAVLAYYWGRRDPADR
jgi:hypothetical protein